MGSLQVPATCLKKIGFENIQGTFTGLYMVCKGYMVVSLKTGTP